MNQKELLKDLRKQVKALEDDLRERSEVVADYKTKMGAEYAQAREAKRTATTYEAWRDERITQVAAAWALACVFLRFCEDNRLIADPFLAGPGERLKDAEDRDADFFRLNPEKNDRDWLVHAFESLAATNPAVAGLFNRAHNPLWELAPSYEAASALLKFWRRRGPDGQIVHDFTDEPVVGEDGIVEHDGLSTRFLGDLYQDLSEHVRKTYALLQTPEFVEEFILDLTLEPAVREFGLEPEAVVGGDGEIGNGLRTIDPACGSGHFLLGLFKRLLAKWQKAEPGTDVWELIRRTSESVHGCDKNPFAVSIARFRLLIAALQAGGAKRLDQAPAFPINVAVGDSLLHGRGAAGIQGDLLSDGEVFAYRTEDVKEHAARCDLLGVSTYHVVVGNPPYITVKDKQENENYRAAYSACAGTYALSVPFAQRLFQLAIRTSGSDRAAGYVGQITANSFMKREFGRRLIEDFFVNDREGVHLTHIIDTSGAYIPGHGTPTVVLIGRNHIPRQADLVRSIMGVRGEPEQPQVAARGNVWRAIVTQVGHAGSESEWISVGDISRDHFSTFPWSLAGGGAAELLTLLDRNTDKIKNHAVRVGFYGDSHADEAFTLPKSGPLARRKSELHADVSHRGDQTRDWGWNDHDLAVLPYDFAKEILPESDLGDYFVRHFWPLRSELWLRGTFGGETYRSDDRDWWAWHQLPKDSTASSYSIVFAEVSTHNHFALDRGGKIFNRTAPVVKLPTGASDSDHLELLGVLNSSVACFWLKQVCHKKGGSIGSGGGKADQPWSWSYQFNSTKLEQFPLPACLPLALGRALNAAAQELVTHEPSAVCVGQEAPTRASLDLACAAHTAIRERMMALQEEIDWEVYGDYGLVRMNGTNDRRLTVAELATLPSVKLGERAFEIVLARKVAAGELETEWFTRHQSTPITEIPARWPNWYRVIVQNRIDVIEKRKDIALIERPECKRRWTSEPWEKREKEALRTWLLDRAEDRRLWFTLRDGFEQPRPLTISQLADELSRLDPEVSSVATLYAADHLGKRDLPLEAVLVEALDAEHVPYLAALRYKDTGLRKRAQWEQVWDLQRKEDAGERLDIPVPPRYTSADFVKTSYWSNRGKLDLPKERFVSYPDANPDADPTLLLGWAGWDHRDQAQALVNIVKDRTSQLSWDDARITPLLTGLAELMPWVRQWFGTDDDEWGGNAADEFGAFLDIERAKRSLTTEQLAAWRPASKTRGRKAAATAAPHTAKKTDTSAATPTA